MPPGIAERQPRSFHLHSELSDGAAPSQCWLRRSKNVHQYVWPGKRCRNARASSGFGGCQPACLVWRGTVLPPPPETGTCTVAGPGLPVGITPGKHHQSLTAERLHLCSYERAGSSYRRFGMSVGDVLGVVFGPHHRAYAHLVVWQSHHRLAVPSNIVDSNESRNVHAVAGSGHRRRGSVHEVFSRVKPRYPAREATLVNARHCFREVRLNSTCRWRSSFKPELAVGVGCSDPGRK